MSWQGSTTRCGHSEAIQEHEGVVEVTTTVVRSLSGTAGWRHSPSYGRHFCVHPVVSPRQRRVPLVEAADFHLEVRPAPGSATFLPPPAAAHTPAALEDSATALQGPVASDWDMV